MTADRTLVRKEGVMSLGNLLGRSFRAGTGSVLCLLTGCLAACSSEPAATPTGQAASAYAQNPYAVQKGGHRHWIVPTRATADQWRAWRATQHTRNAAAATAGTVLYGGGIDGIGVTSGVPRVYLVFWGSQWSGGGDPNGASAYLQNLFRGIGTGGEQWSGTMTQYCDGPGVPKGAASCDTTTTPHVGYPNSGALAGVWVDTSSAAPANATTAQLAQEAVAASTHFGNTTAASNRYVQYFIVSPSGTHPDGFNTSGSNFCGWHDYTTSSHGDLAYANMPYVSDAGAACGANFVNGTSSGLLDGFSLVAGHEYAETLTDQNPPGGWTAASGAEVGDECAWISSGQGASANVTMSTGAFAMQSIWSNDTNECDISHKIL
jgi:serine protease